MKMNKCAIVGIVSVILSVVIFTGCATSRDAIQKEYARLAALPPGVMVVSPNLEVANVAKASCDTFSVVQPMMKAYVDKTESNREYTGFMNDIAYYVKEEKMTEQAACKKVHDDVIAADAKRPADQKLWPKIAKGIAAANELDPKVQLTKIAALTARNLEIRDSVKNLPTSFQSEDFMGKAQRVKECSAISAQVMDSAECLVFLGEQYRRVIELETYVR